jgi:hypothetical protein
MEASVWSRRGPVVVVLLQIKTEKFWDRKIEGLWRAI